MKCVDVAPVQWQQHGGTSGATGERGSVSMQYWPSSRR
jgi:hypothetical protein